MAEFEELTSPQALERLQAALKDGRKANENKLIMLVDVIICHGSNEEKLAAFRTIPARNCYGLARMLILRNLWLLGEGFIASDWFREQFEPLPLRNEEYKKMSSQFGKAAVADFFKPAVLRR